MMPDTFCLPVVWDFDRIHAACAKLAELTGRDFEAEMLAAAHSGELPADGCCGWADSDAGNLEIARRLGNEATVLWDQVAEWLRAKGFGVARGKWMEFGEALAQLQARIRPAPTAAELEFWTGFSCGLTAYVDANPRQRYLIDSFFDWENPELPDRRLHLWLDSEEVANFEPPSRVLTMPQLCERWKVSEPKARARLDSWPEVISWPLLCQEAQMPFELVIDLDNIKANEAENPEWLKFDAFAPNPGRQEFPFLDLRERERFDAQRLQELIRTDPAGEYARLRAAAAVGGRLSCWLEPARIADLYGDSLVATLVERAVFDAGTLPARAVCRGAAVHVDDWLHWPGRPPIPGGEAGELVRAWLGLAESESVATPAPAETAAAELVAVPDAVALPVQPRRKTARDTWASVMLRAIRSALNEWERRSRREADVYQFVRNWLEQDARFDWKTTEAGTVWIYPLDSGGFKEIRDASLCRSVRREMDRRNAEQPGADTVRTAGHCDDECPAVS